MSKLARLQVAIIAGSKSDVYEKDGTTLKEHMKALQDVLETAKVGWSLSIISAHRNPLALDKHCATCLRVGTSVFIGLAGMAAALPGAIAASINNARLVLGVALTSPESPDAMDALLSITRMPPGMSVNCSGIGTAGATAAAIAACQIVALSDPEVANGLGEYFKKKKRHPEYNVLGNVPVPVPQERE